MAVASSSGASRCNRAPCGGRRGGGWGMASPGEGQDGARAADVVERQLPAFAAWTATPDARFDLGCLYIGVNDVRALDRDPGRFESDFGVALGKLTDRCDRALTLTAPLALGRPRVGSGR